MNKEMASVFGKILRFDPKVHEIKVFQNGELTNESDMLNEKISNWKKIPDDLPAALKVVYDKVTDQGIPLVPFPNI